MRSPSRWPAMQALTTTAIRDAVYAIGERLRPSVTEPRADDARSERVREEDDIWSEEVARRTWASAPPPDDG